MPSVASIALRMPAWAQSRYIAASHWVPWLNDLLEECSAEPRLFKELYFQTGAIVERNKWIDLPTGCRQIFKIFNQENPDQQFTWKVIGNQIELTDAVADDLPDSYDTATTFSDAAVDSITIDKTGVLENQYKDYLFLITAGTRAGIGYILSGNDASDGSDCVLYFLHDLVTAFGALEVTAVDLVSPDYYVVVEHSSTYPEVTDGSSEVPIDDKYERRLTKAWLLWKIFEDVDPSLPQAVKAEKNYREVLKKVKRELRTSTGGRIIPRDIPGLNQYANDTYGSIKDYEEEI